LQCVAVHCNVHRVCVEKLSIMVCVMQCVAV